MPTIGTGRISVDGSGTVSFSTDTTSATSTTGATSTISTALSITGNTEGNGSPVFLNQSSNIGNVVLNFATLAGGTNVTLDTTTSPGTIIINAATGSGGGNGGVHQFIQLTDGPQAYSTNALLFSTSSGVAWTTPPNAANQFLYWNGAAFAFTANIVTGVAAVGSANQISVAGSPITSSGTFIIGLAAIGTAGTYSTVTVDMFGRVVAGTVGGNTTVSLSGDVSGSGATNTTFSTTLVSVQSGGVYSSTTGIGVINSVDSKGRVISSRALALADLTSVGAAVLASPAFTGTPTAPTPSINDNTTKLATTAWVTEQGYIKSPITITGDAGGTSSGSSISVTLASIMTAGTYTQVTVDSKGRVVAGSQSSGSGVPSGGVAGQVLALVGSTPTWVYQVQDFYVQYPGVFTNSQNIFNIKCARPLTFPQNFTGSYLTFGTAATSNVTFNITKNSTQIGTITVASSATTGVFNISSQTVFATGDVLQITLSGTADATLANGALTLTCTR